MTTTAQSAQAYRRGGVAVLALVAAVGAVLSWGSLYEAASTGLGSRSPHLGPVNLVGAAFPLLLDALILGASLVFVGGVKAGRPVAGWRLAAHAGIVGTIGLNAAAASSLTNMPWHVVAPTVWSVIVELYARDVLGELREVRRQDADRIPLRLWLTTPGESIRASWRMARTGETNADTARAVTERCAAARDQLAAHMPGVASARRRRQILRRLWAGALDPATLVQLIDSQPDPAALHRAVLRAVASGSPLPAVQTRAIESRPEVQSSTSTDPESGPSESTTPVQSHRVHLDPWTPTSPAPVAALQSGPRRIDAAIDTTDQTSEQPVQDPTARQAEDLQKIHTAVATGQITGRITKAKIREHLRCSNPHAGEINSLYQHQTAS